MTTQVDRTQLREDVRLALLESDSERHFKHHDEEMAILKDIQLKLSSLPCNANDVKREALEKRVENLEKSQNKKMWIACIVSAIIGGLVARLAPDAIWHLVEALFKGHGL